MKTISTGDHVTFVHYRLGRITGEFRWPDPDEIDMFEPHWFADHPSTVPGAPLTWGFVCNGHGDVAAYIVDLAPAVPCL